MSTVFSSSGAVDGLENSSRRPLPPPSRRRDKPQLSCTLCRKRKLKCDREQPCETCVRRGLSLSCTYVQPNAVERNQARPPEAVSIQERISQLESLVLSQMNSVKSPNTEPDNEENSAFKDQSQLANSFGRISVENSEVAYVESAHWTSILDGIKELKDCFEEGRDSTKTDTTLVQASYPNAPELLFGGYKYMQEQDIFAAIPPRPIADRLIAKCFSSVEIAPLILHSPTFLKEYEHFWDRPQETSFVWLALFFGMMCLAVLNQQSDPDNASQTPNDPPFSDPKRLIRTYREKSSQCLIYGKYTNGAPYTIEALLLYLHIEYLQSEDTQTGVWMVLGMISRLALRMGYHRDASNFLGISPFCGEMRRRVWIILSMMDVATSTQYGLPRMIRQAQSNTKEPRNLKDEDIDENMIELPEPRPENDQTPVQYFVAKSRVVSAFGKICDLATLTKSPQYGEILRLDGILHQAHDNIPQWLNIRPMSKSIMDGSNVIMQRIYVALIFYKAKLFLHRTYLLSARTDRRYTYSRSACIEAALDTLKIQQMMDQETQVGGRLYQDRGRVSSLVRNDFLLATTILCVDFNHAIDPSMSSKSHEETELNEDVMSALRKAYTIWQRSSDSSHEAQKAVSVLKFVLEKVSTHRSEQSCGAQNAQFDSRGMSQEAQKSAGVPMFETEYAQKMRTQAFGDVSARMRHSTPPSNSTLEQTSLPARNPVLQPLNRDAGGPSLSPLYLPNLPAKNADYPTISSGFDSSGGFPRFNEMDFDWDNWDPRDQTESINQDSEEIQKVPKLFGWILPGGGSQDAF